jgi:hypothetical protein
MEQIIDNLVVEFFAGLFQRVFSNKFKTQIPQRRKLMEVTRQVQESADAASQSLTRFFLNRQLKEKQVTAILECFESLDKFLKLENRCPRAVPVNKNKKDKRKGGKKHDKKEQIITRFRAVFGGKRTQ